MEDNFVPLCTRCDNRANYLETGHGFRYECQSETASVRSCYAYLPVRPLLLRRDPHDKRRFGYRTVAVRALPAATIAVPVKRKGRKRAKTWARVAVSPELDYKNSEWPG